MYVARISTRVPLTKQTTAQLSKAVAGFAQYNGLASSTANLRLSGLYTQKNHRNFSTTSQTRLREIFPEPDHNQIAKTDPAWKHPEYVPLCPFFDLSN